MNLFDEHRTDLESSIRTVINQCPYVKVLSLRNCGYVLTDHFCEQIIRVVS
jgi:hypothetical protein